LIPLVDGGPPLHLLVEGKSCNGEEVNKGKRTTMETHWQPAVSGLSTFGYWVFLGLVDVWIILILILCHGPLAVVRVVP